MVMLSYFLKGFIVSLAMFYPLLNLHAEDDTPLLSHLIRDPAQASGIHTNPPLIFRAEFAKPEIYTGELVMVNFVVYSEADVLDIEVAKFPEFRGFWSENFTLRQGPIQLLTDAFSAKPDTMKWKKASIGSYLLSSMVGKSNPTLLPMKIMVRPVTGNFTAGVNPAEPEAVHGDSFDCSYDALKIKPLPALPANFSAAQFPNAVGNFNLAPENNEVVFQKDEPTTLRYVLQGEGNFQEINQLSLPQVKDVEILSSRSTIQGTGQSSRKVFETTLAVHSSLDFTFPELQVVTFNPTLGLYVVLTTPRVPFRFEPQMGAKEPGAPEIFQNPIDATWSANQPAAHQLWFWLTQILLIVATIGIILAKVLPEHARRRKTHPDFLRKLKWQAAIREYRVGNVAGFLKIADALALELITAKAKIPRGLTRTRAIMLASKKLDPTFLTHARHLFEAYERLCFTPQKPSPENLPDLEKSLAYLMEKSPLKAA